MTQSVYIIGGAGTGKSTFTAQLMRELDLEAGPLVDIHAKPNKKNLVTLRGHWLTGDILYLGVLRENFPGSDGLDRVSGPVGEDWLRNFELPRYILGEGATLATRGFLGALHDTTRLVVFCLTAPEETKRTRFEERGSVQDPKFVTATATRTFNLRSWLKDRGVSVVDVNTVDDSEWYLALDIAGHLLKS